MSNEGMYQPEIDYRDICFQRSVIAENFAQSVLVLCRAIQEKKDRKVLQNLITEAEALRRIYDLICSAADAMTTHHSDAALVNACRSYADDLAAKRLDRSRDKIEDSKDPGIVMLGILHELRGIRDAVAPPVGDWSDIAQARKVIASQQT